MTSWAQKEAEDRREKRSRPLETFFSSQFPLTPPDMDFHALVAGWLYTESPGGLSWPSSFAGVFPLQSLLSLQDIQDCLWRKRLLIPSQTVPGTQHYGIQAFHEGLLTSAQENTLFHFVDKKPIKRLIWAFKISAWLLSVQSKEQRARVYKEKVINILGDILIQKQTNNNFPRFTSFSKAKMCCRKILPTPQSQL